MSRKYTLTIGMSYRNKLQLSVEFIMKSVYKISRLKRYSLWMSEIIILKLIKKKKTSPPAQYLSLQ